MIEILKLIGFVETDPSFSTVDKTLCFVGIRHDVNIMIDFKLKDKFNMDVYIAGIKMKPTDQLIVDGDYDLTYVDLKNGDENCKLKAISEVTAMMIAIRKNK